MIVRVHKWNLYNMNDIWTEQIIFERDILEVICDRKPK